MQQVFYVLIQKDNFPTFAKVIFTPCVSALFKERVSDSTLRVNKRIVNPDISLKNKA